MAEPALSCRKSAGTKSRQASLNAVVKRAFVSAGFVCVLGTRGCVARRRKEARRTYRGPVEPGKVPHVGCRLCVYRCNLTSVSHQQQSRSGSCGSGAKKAGKVPKHYWEIYFRAARFWDDGIMGTWRDLPCAALRRKIKNLTGERRATEYLGQRFSIEIQRGSAASIFGTVQPSANLNEISSMLRSNSKQMANLFVGSYIVLDFFVVPR